MLQAFATIVIRQAAIPRAVTGFAAAAAQTRPMAAISISSFAAGRKFAAGVGAHWFPLGSTGPDPGVSAANAVEDIIKANKPILKVNGPYLLQKFTKFSFASVSDKPESVP